MGARKETSASDMPKSGSWSVALRRRLAGEHDELRIRTCATERDPPSAAVPRAYCGSGANHAYDGERDCCSFSVGLYHDFLDTRT
jgi:hypothetical protein